MTMDHLVWRRAIATIAWAMIGVGLITSVPFVEAASGITSKLVGTWRIVRFTDTDPGGKVTYPFGEKPRGYIVYDATGHLSVQVMRMPARLPFAAGDDDKGTDAEVRAAYDGYAAYFGTYRVDEVNNIITHVVEGSLKPSYTGTDQPRPFKLDGDVLIIQGRDKDGSTYYRELHRVK